MRANSPIILALDSDDLSTAQQWIEATRESIDIYKVGLEFFLKHGARGLQELREVSEFELFLDLKLHDIPNTVAGAVSSIRELKPRFLTVHAAGGGAMVKAAVEAAPEISITGVTVLTSLSAEELTLMGVEKSPLDYAVSLAKRASESGARAIVCSPLEVAAIRAEVGSQIELITPGVRPVGSELGDQSRVMTPSEAVAAGANFLVIGRPISSYFQRSPEAMRERAHEILESLS
jgi:orotidine-5'-phosphate decarboxylase